MSTRPPELVLDADGRHVWWRHECSIPDCTADGWDPVDPSTWVYWREAMLPLDDARGWRVESIDPLTVSPSILCGSCGLHGWWRSGAWVPA
jgi:hypothetical protein